MKKYLIIATFLLIAQNCLSAMKPTAAAGPKSPDAAIELKNQISDIKNMIKTKMPEFYVHLQTITPALATKKIDSLSFMAGMALGMADGFIQEIKNKNKIEKTSNFLKAAATKIINLQEAIENGNKNDIEKLVTSLFNETTMEPFPMRYNLKELNKKMPKLLADFHTAAANIIPKLPLGLQNIAKKIDANIDQLADKILKAATTFLNYAVNLEMRNQGITRPTPTITPEIEIIESDVTILPVRQKVLPTLMKK